MKKKVVIVAVLLALFAIFYGRFSWAGQSELEEGSMTGAASQTVMTAAIDEPAPDFTLMSVDGTKHSLSDYKGKYVVLEWVNFECPFVRKHYNSGNMQALQAKFTDKDVAWLSICSSAPGKQGYFNGEELRERIKKENSHASAYLIDSDGKVGRMYSAQTTPSMFVIDAKGILRYAGAIDDKPSTKVDDVKGADNYVSDALTSLMAGKKVSTRATKSYGCSVKY